MRSILLLALVLGSCGVSTPVDRSFTESFFADPIATDAQIPGLVAAEMSEGTPSTAQRLGSSALPHVVFYIENEDDFTRRVVRWMAYSSVEVIFRAIWLAKLPESHLHFVSGPELLNPTKRQALVDALNADPSAPIDVYTMTHSGGGAIQLPADRFGSIFGVLGMLPSSLSSRFRFFFNLGCFGDMSISPALLAGFKVAAGSKGTTMGPLIALSLVQALDNGASFKQALGHVQWACRNKLLWRTAIWVFREDLEESDRDIYCPSVDFHVSTATDQAARLNDTLRSVASPTRPSPLAELAAAPVAGESQPIVAPIAEISAGYPLAGPDLGFRYDAQSRCVNGAGVLGYNLGYLGECGDLRDRKIIGLDVARTSLRGARFDGAFFVQSRFNSVDATGASFVGALLISSTITNQCKLQNSQWQNALGFWTSFLSSDAHDSSFLASRFYAGSFSTLNFVGADLRKAEWMAPLSMTRWQASNAKLQGANLRSFNYSLPGSTFQGATYDAATAVPNVAFKTGMTLVPMDASLYQSSPPSYGLDEDLIAPKVATTGLSSVTTAKY